MERNAEIVNWLTKMGYDGEIPVTLGNICNNNSTTFIWDQLIENSKPRQEVDDIRNNILIHRLNSKPMNKQRDFPYPMKEIDLFSKKTLLEDKSKMKQFLIDEQKTRDHEIYSKIKFRCMTIDKLKAKIKENEERKYLLRRKSKLFEKDIQQAQDTLNFLGILTPVELDVEPDTKEITRTLEECSEKLKELLHKYPAPVKELPNRKNSICYSSRKLSANPTLFEKYLTSTEKKTSKHLTIIRQGHSTQNKENINSSKVTKCLFSEKKATGCDTTQNIRSNKRESLGILPDDCLTDNTMLGYSLTEDNTFLSSMRPMQSAVLNSPFLGNRSRSEIRCGGDDTHPRDLKKEYLTKLYGSEVVTENLRGLIHKNNRQIVWNLFQNLGDNLHLDIAKYLVLEHRQKSHNKGVDYEDISRLQFLHVQTEFQILKHNAISKHLAQQIDKKIANVYVSITSKGFSAEKTEDIKRSFEQQFEDAGLEATLKAMKNEIGSAKNAKNKNDLQIQMWKLSQLKENMSVKIRSIQEYVEFVRDILSLINHTRDTAVACVRKIVHFIGDMSWTSTLVAGVCSGEMEVFEKFPLEFNRRCIHIDSSAPVYYRNMCTDSLPSDLEIDDSHLYMLAEILESPFSFPETVVLDILRAKLKLDVLKSMKNPPKTAGCKKYSLEELQLQESYINFALDRFNSIIHSSSSKKTLASSEVMKNVTDLWLKMPFRDFIPATRTVEGEKYVFYENKFDSFYNNL